MGQTAGQIERHISEERQRLEQNILAIEGRARSSVDWRAQFDARPVAMLSAAFGAGMLLSRILGW
jgi:hypothetical protein